MSHSTSRLVLAALALGSALIGCTETKTISTPIPAGKHSGQIELNPVFSQSARTIAASLGDFGLTFDRVHIVIRNNPDTTVTVADTTVAFGPTSASLTLDITVPVDVDGEVFNARVEYAGPNGVVFAGSVLVKSHAADQPAPEQAPLILSFAGPGAKVKTISLSPDPVQLIGATTTPITIAAIDSSGATIAVPPLLFASTDASVATIATTQAGRVVQSFGKRGSVLLTATTPTGISDTVSAVVTLPASGIVLVSGGGQTGTVGGALASTAVVQVNAADGVGVGGVAVTFAAPIGGAVGSATATTDANGRASTTMTLATAAGPQSFVATAAGFSVPIPATAVAGPASPATSTISSSVAHIKADNTTAATITVQLEDQFGNAISSGGAAVKLTTTLGHFGSTGNVTTVDATDLGNGKYSAQLFSAHAGSATITGTVGGAAITASATVPIDAIPPGAIVLVSGGGQPGTVGTTLPSPVVVQVNSADGIAIPDVVVTFSAPSGASVSNATVTTDANGRASTTLTLATGAGTQNFTATASTFSVTIAETAVAGPASPATSTISSSVAHIKADNTTAATITVQLKDQFGNATTSGGAAVKLTTTLGHFGSTGNVTTVDATDLGNGKYSAQLFSAHAGTATITGTVGGAAITALATVTIDAIPPGAIVLVSGGGQPGTVGTTLPSPVVVQVNSADGIAIPDVVVTFSAPSGGSVGNATVTTDASGRASTTLTLATGAGTQNFTATASTFSVTIPETAVAGPASPATSTITTSTAQINADNTSSAVITVHTKDQFGNVIGTGGASVTLTTTLGHFGAGTATTTTATDAGDGTYTATLLSAQSGTATITGTIGGTAIAPPSVTVTAIATVLDHFDVTLADGSAITGNKPAGVATAIRVRALDASGNVITTYNSQTLLSIINSTLIGGPTVVAPAAVSGVITTSVKFGQPGQNVRLVATGASKTGQSAAFTVVPGPAAAITTNDSILVYRLDETPANYPTIFVTDGAGNGTGQQSVAFTVTAPCTLAGGGQTAQFTSDVEGAIVFDATKITIPTGGAETPFSCLLTGTGVGFTAPSPARSALLVQPSGSSVWTAHTSDAWATTDNWTASVPSSAVAAFIAASQPRATPVYPILRTGNATAASIDVEDGGRVDLNGNALTVFENIDTRTSGLIFNGTLIATGNGGGLRGSIETLDCQGGSHLLTGITQITHSMTMSNCQVDLAGTGLAITQNLTMGSGSSIVMNTAPSTVQVFGSATFGGAPSELTAGVLFVEGNFTQTGSGNFAPSGNHTVALGTYDTKNQVVNFDDVTSSQFENLSIRLVTGKTVTINSAVKVAGALTVVSTGGGTLSLPAGLKNQLNGPISLTGSMAVNLGGVINTSLLSFAGGTVTLTGAAQLALGNGSLNLGDNLHLSVNAMGTLGIDAANPPRCTHGTNVMIDGTNNQAVAVLKQACGIQ